MIKCRQPWLCTLITSPSISSLWDIRSDSVQGEGCYSHSMVEGGLLVTS